MLQINTLDHLVLTVANINRTCQFYKNNLGFEIIAFEENLKALSFGQQKINLHEAGKEIEPKALYPTPGSADLCFISAFSIDQVIEKLAVKGIAVEMGPVNQSGARGSMLSVYIRDPDNNLIEIASYND